MGGSERELARGKANWQAKLSVFVGDNKETMGEDTDITAHPRVHITADADKHLRNSKGLFIHLALDRLAEIEFFVFLRQRVDVVKERIGVPDAEFLIHHHAEDARRVDAAFLVEDRYFSGWRHVGVLGQTFEIDKNFGETVRGANLKIGFSRG